MTNEASWWDKLNAISYFKAHLKYRDTTARETVANDREKCALKWLFVELVVETDTFNTNIALVNATLENDTGFKSRKSLHLNPLSNSELKLNLLE